MKINIYTCNKCGGQIITRDLVDGTTPFMIACVASGGDYEVNRHNEQIMTTAILQNEASLVLATKDPKCNGDMQSCFYSCDQTLTPGFEWYFPEADEYNALDVWTRFDHVDKGGLLLRPIKVTA